MNNQQTMVQFYTTRYIDLKVEKKVFKGTESLRNTLGHLGLVLQPTIAMATATATQRQQQQPT